MKRGMTAAAFQSDNTKERLNKLVIGVATISADNFRKKGSKASTIKWVRISDCSPGVADGTLQLASSEIIDVCSGIDVSQ